MSDMKVVKGVYVLRTTRICKKSDEDEAFDAAVKDAFKKFEAGDWGEAYPCVKESNDKDTNSAMGVYRHGPFHFIIHRSNGGRRITVSFPDER